MKSPTPENSGKWLNTIGYYAVFVAFGLTAVALGPTLPRLAAHTHTNLSEISVLFPARSLGFLIGAFLGGRLYDRVPGHPLMACMLIIMAMIFALIPVMPLLWLLTALVLILGVSLGMVEVGGNTLLAWVHRHNIGPPMNGLHFFFGVGAFLSPVIIARVIKATGDITWSFWILALIIIPAAVWMFTLPSPAIHGISKDGQKDHINYLLVIPLTLIFLLYVGSEISFGGWIYTYTITVHSGTKIAAAHLTAAFWGSFTVGRLLAIPISARFAPSTILLIDFWGCLLSVGIILTWPTSFKAVWVGTLGTGLSMASIFPTLLTFAERRMKISGKVNGWFFGGSGLGGMTLPWFIGQVFESVGPRSTMITILIDVLIALGIFVGVMYLTSKTRRRQV